GLHPDKRIRVINSLRCEFGNGITTNWAYAINGNRTVLREAKTTEMDAVMSSGGDAAETLPEPARVLLDAWFGPAGDPAREQHREIWFKGGAEFDASLRDAFL